jgi:PKD repeat protein
LLRTNVLFKRPTIFAIALLMGACTTTKQDAPPFAGPSELALSLAITAVPDVITQDGTSQSMLTVVARDKDGQPIRGLSLRLAMNVDGQSQDYGTLSTKSISTDNSGQASALYTAPAPPPLTVTSDRTIAIDVTPVGSNFDNTIARTVSIHLARPGVILPPNPKLVPSFFYSPQQPHESESIQFDASASTGAIVSYAWNFGDGTSGTGVRPTHTYGVTGTYNVTLTITDDRGTQATSAPSAISVVSANPPTASFTISPTDPGVNADIYFDASKSTVPTGRTIVSYDWNFGDGAIGAGRTATHKYGKANTYTVVLTVTDNSGRQGVSSLTITVK